MSTLRELLNNRVSKQLRPTMRYSFCLDPELQSDWLAAKQELAALPPVDPDGGGGRVRMNGGARAVASKRLAELETEVAEVTVVGVFTALTPERFAELLADWRAKDTETPEQATTLILECFTGFERDGEPVPAEELGKDDLAALLPVLTQGERYGLSTPLSQLTNGLLDLPKSRRLSGAPRNSATS